VVADHIRGRRSVPCRGAFRRSAELLKEAVPHISRVLVLTYLDDSVVPLQVKALQEAAPSLGIRLLIREIRTADDLPAALV
jgi:putative ABC transport system substrate-binding protein